MDKKTYQFGDWLIEPHLNRISRDGEDKHLEPKTMDVLAYFLEHKGDVVSFDELLDRFWQGRIVEEGTIHRHIQQIRRILGDDAKDPTYIETIAKRGYRAIAPIEPMWGTRDGASSDRLSAVEAQTPSFPAYEDDGHPRQIWWSLATAVGVVLIIAGWWFWPHDVVPQRDAVPGVPSIAVLPFVNISDDPGNEYFSDGISEEILNRLRMIPNIRVIARTSSFQFKGQNLDVRAIGESLNVSYVLEGSVRKSGNRVRIAAQLIETRDGTNLWSERYNRELADIFAVQDEIAASILSELDVHFQDRELHIGGTRVPEAYGAYLMARNLYNAFRPEEALEHFTRATELDPDYADAHAGIVGAMMYPGPGFDFADQEPARLQRALDRALSLQPEHVEVLAWQAVLISSVEHDHQRAIDLLHKLVTRAPHNHDVLGAYRRVLFNVRRHDLIVRLDAHHVSLDPLSGIVVAQYAHSLANVGRWDEARQIAARSRAMGFPPVVTVELDIAIGSGDLAVIPGLLAQAREVWPFIHQSEPAYYVAIGDDAAVARLIEELHNEGTLEGQYFGFLLTGDEASALRVWEEALEREPVSSTGYSKVVPWPVLMGKSSIWPWKHFNESVAFERVRQKVGLDNESVAHLKVLPLPF